jgi:hypothetical protein
VNSVRYVLAIALLLFAIWVVVSNWAFVIITIRNKRGGIDRNLSTVPFASILFTFVASVVYPGADKLWMISIPLLDIGNWEMLGLSIVSRGTRQ